MIVAQLIETLAAGGAENLAVQIANTWVARGHRSHLFVLQGDGPFRDRVDPGVTLHDLDLPPSDRPMALRIPGLLRAHERLNGLIGRNGIEILQTHLPMANFLGLGLAWRRACRVFPTVHNNREFDYGDRSGPFREKMRRLAYRRMVSDCRRMIAVSKPVQASMLAELGLTGAWGDRIAVVPNGVPVPELPGAAERVAARSGLGVTGAEVVIAGLGRLTDQKNFADLLVALAGLPPDTPPWRAVVAGEGELRGAFEEQLAQTGLGDRVAFPGHRGDVTRFLAAADVFCLPSKYEGLPLALLEAMAHGLPVAAYAIDGVTEVVTDREQALLAPPGDTAALGGALARLIGDPALRRRLGTAARALVQQEHSFDRVADRLEEVYAS